MEELSISLMSIVSSLCYLSCLVLVLWRRKSSRLTLEEWLPLVLALLMYSIVTFSNILEHLHITSYLDSVEDIMEIIFTLTFLFFVNNWRKQRTIQELSIKERLLHRKQQELENYFTSSLDLFCIANMDGKFLRVNEEWEHILGLSVSEITNRNFMDFVHPDDVEKTLEAVTELSENKLVCNFTNRYRHVDGSYRYIEWRSKASGRVIYASARDITNRLMAEQEIIRSRNMLTDVLEHIPDRVFWKDLNGVFLGCNLLVAKDSGLTSTDQVIGKTDYDMAWKEQADAFRADDRKVISEGKPKLKYEERITTMEGKDLWIRTSKVPLYDSFRKTYGVLGVWEDITDRKISEINLVQSEENLRTTLNSIGDAVIATDTNGRIVRINPVAEKLTGWDIAEASGKDLQEVFVVVDSHTREIIPNPAETVLKTGNPSEIKFSALLVNRTGREYRIADSAAPIMSNSKIMGVVIVFRDVTNEYAMQERLNHSQKMDAVGQLAGGIAHDFNNMLGGIMGATEILLRQEQDATKLKFLSMIMTAATRSADLAGKLLAFARRQVINSTSVNVHEAINDAISLLENTIDKRINIHKDFSAENCTVTGDFSQLQNVFLNLGINSSHAMPEGGDLYFLTHNIDVTGPHYEELNPDMKEGAYLQVEVKDSGNGIAPKDLPHIFEPFFTTKKQGEGTGLGLAAAYGTIQQHKGTITVYSEHGHGTIFHIFLPISEADSRASDVNAEIVNGEGVILLADDEDIMRSVGQAILESCGYDILLAKNGKDALEKFKQYKDEIDMVILDMVMPEMNGRQCFYEIKKLCPEVKAVLSSGFCRPAEIEEMREQGLLGFIQKPFKASELSNIIAEKIKGS